MEIVMAEDTKQTLERLARALRGEAAELEHRHIEQFKELRQAMPGDRDYQRGCLDTLRRSARLLDEGEGE